MHKAGVTSGALSAANRMDLFQDTTYLCLFSFMNGEYSAVRIINLMFIHEG